MRRTLAFGDLDMGPWGVAWIPPQGGGLVTIGARGGASSTIAVSGLEGSDPASEWTLSGEGVALSVAPESGPAVLVFGDADLDGFDQLCRVRGRFEIDGTSHVIDCLGRRGTRSEATKAESIRELAAWFGDDEGLALVSIRGRRAGGHDADAISAALFEEGQPVSVADPRLSTTYTASGAPASAGLELWLEESGSEEPETAYARRAAGEAVGQSWTGEQDGLELHVELFRWHMRGREGTGVYQLIRTR
jgi:hypothetical protein